MRRKMGLFVLQIPILNCEEPLVESVQYLQLLYADSCAQFPTWRQTYAYTHAHGHTDTRTHAHAYHARTSKGGLTYQLTNCSDIVTEDLTILSAPQMAVTGFNGHGGHVFRRLQFKRSPHASPSTTMVSSQDAVHFSDLRRGPIIEDSVIGLSGDDFFNVHTTFMTVLKCEGRRSCLIMNGGCELPGSLARPGYAHNCPMATVVPGDHLSFFGWPKEDLKFPPLPGAASKGDGGGGGGGGSAAEVETITMVDTPASLAEANATVQVMHGNASGAWTSWTNNSFVYGMNVLWQVNFTEPLPPVTWAALTAPRASTRGPPIATVDEINMAGAVIRNNTFTKTACNLGRFKSPGGSITGNRFSDASLRNLEVTPLLQWFEGPIVLDGMQIENNIFTGVGADPIHCGPLCEMSVVRV